MRNDKKNIVFQFAKIKEFRVKKQALEDRKVGSRGPVDLKSLRESLKKANLKNRKPL